MATFFPCSLEDALRQQAAELERRGRDWAAREAALSCGHTRSRGATAAAHAELGVAHDALDAAAKRVRALEADNAELRKQKAQVAADKRMLEELLSDGDAERRGVGGGGGRGVGLLLGLEGTWTYAGVAGWQTCHWQMISVQPLVASHAGPCLPASHPAANTRLPIFTRSRAPLPALPCMPCLALPCLPCPALPALPRSPLACLPAGSCTTIMCGWGSAWRRL